MFKNIAAVACFGLVLTASAAVADEAKMPNADDYMKFDTSGDGALDKAEITASAMAQNVKDQFMSGFDAVDTDKDGKISKAELTVAIEHHKATHK